MEKWTKRIPAEEITGTVTKATIDFAKDFCRFLTTKEEGPNPKDPSKKIVREKLTTSQLRKFFGEVKRIQMNGYDATEFILLKPKLAYAVAKEKKNSKMTEFYEVLSEAIDLVDNEEKFKNFIKVFEAIVAYHKVAESGIKL